MINLTFIGMFFFVFPYMFDDAWIPVIAALYVFANLFFILSAR